jgi:hypothetical protein
VADRHPLGSLQFDIKTLLILTAFVAVVVQLSLLIWAVLPVRLPYVIYALHLFWTGSWLAVVLAATWFLAQVIRHRDLDTEQTSSTNFDSPTDPERKELRRLFRLAIGWGIMNQLLWLGFTLSAADNNAQWFLAVVYLQMLPAAWVSQGLQLRRYIKSPAVLLRVMYFANTLGFLLPLLSLPHSIIRSM